MSILKSFSLIGVLSIISVALSFISQIVFSYYFGTSSELDAYWIAFAIINLLAFPLISLREALVSEIHQHLDSDMKTASTYFSKVMSLILIVSFFGSIIALLFPKDLIKFISGDKSVILNAEIFAKLIWMAPALILMAVSDTLSALLTSYNRTAFQMVSRILASGSAIAVIALTANWIGSQALVFGFIASQTINLFALAGMLYRQGLSFRLTLPTSLGKNFLALSATLLFSNGINQFYAIYEKYSFLNFGSGIISAFQYSVSITNIVITVLGLSLANLFWPRFLKHATAKNMGQFYVEGMLGSKFLLLMLGWVCALIFLNARWIIESIFTRGAFGREALELTVFCLQMTIFAAIPVSLNSLIGRALISTRASKSVVVISLSMAIVGALVLFLATYFKDLHLATSYWLIANLFGSIASGILFIRKAQVSMSVYKNSLWWILRYAVVLVATVSLAFEFLAPYVFSQYGLIDVVCKSLLFTVLYSSLTFLLGLFKGIPLGSLVKRSS